MAIVGHCRLRPGVVVALDVGGSRDWSTALALAAVVYHVSDHAFGLNDNLEIGETLYWIAVSVPVGSV